jgi:hypothetical protein
VTWLFLLGHVAEAEVHVVRELGFSRISPIRAGGVNRALLTTQQIAYKAAKVGA